ncbi:hypothetical protein [Shewanella sp. cp20]|uniref:hypothetical protein n=1 Tax=Shewanella sp. cp20 TaxID=1521167 RepID=UPI001269D532|nr:hypothetical protein [Shewanella sp. cp20]
MGFADGATLHPTTSLPKHYTYDRNALNFDKKAIFTKLHQTSDKKQYLTNFNKSRVSINNPKPTNKNPQKHIKTKRYKAQTQSNRLKKHKQH